MCVRARGRAAVTGAGGEPAAEGSEAADLHAIGVSNDCEDGKATVDPDESSALVLRSMLMAPAGMEGRSFDVQAHIPSVNASGDRRGQDSGARCCYGLTRTWVEVLDGSEHPPQPPGVVVHPDGSDLREDNRPGMSLSDADSVAAARILLVSETKALAVPSFAPVSREADLALCLGVSSERSAKINGGLLEHLGGDLRSPAEAGHLSGSCPIWCNHEHAASTLTCLPAIERIDQVKT
jgi:hypothetical protein